MMNSAAHRSWVPIALVVGGLYLVIGRVFAIPTTHGQAWRLAAWIVSFIAFASHVGYEHFRRRSVPRATALHTASAVAVGAIAIAVAGMIHTLSTGASLGASWLLALLVFPASTGIPAFVAAFVAATVLGRFEKSAPRTDAPERR